MSIEGNKNTEDLGVKDLYANWEEGQFPEIDNPSSISGEEALKMGATGISPDDTLELVNE